jgi:hypothetical protein
MHEVPGDQAVRGVSLAHYAAIRATPALQGVPIRLHEGMEDSVVTPLADYRSLLILTRATEATYDDWRETRDTEYWGRFIDLNAQRDRRVRDYAAMIGAPVDRVIDAIDHTMTRQEGMRWST